MKLGNCCIASLIFYGKGIFCSILNAFYSQNSFILGCSGVIKNIKNSFIFIWIGSIFHICLRCCFRKFHIAASMACITIFFETIWELSTKISFSKGIMHLNFIINLVVMADLHLFFISYVLILLLLRNSLICYKSYSLCLSIFYLRLYLVSILLLATVHLFLFF